MGGEIKTNDLQEVKQPAVDDFTNIKPEKGLSVKEAQSNWDRVFNDNIDKNEVVENQEQIEIGFFTTLKERLDFSGTSKGDWSGEVGNSEFRPENQEARDVLERNGVNGIEYKNGFADFSPVAVESVEIDKMTDCRPTNFNQAYSKLAEKFNQEQKNGKTNWNRQDVEKWKKDNNLSCHEKEDRKTVEFVPTPVHNECKHYGGVAECKRMKEQTGALSGKKEGGFDE